MQSNSHLQALASGVQAQAAATGAIGEGTFLRLVFAMFRDLAYQQIDTDAERDAIKSFVMQLADTFVAPRFPLGWRIARIGLESAIDTGLDNLAEFLQPAS